MSVVPVVYLLYYSFGCGGGTRYEFRVCLSVGWVCAVLSVVGLGALLGLRVRVLGMDKLDVCTAPPIE